jgi:DNA-binding transcriptional LysR family regulator
LHNLSIDFALLALPRHHKDLELQPIRTEPLLVALPEKHPLASNNSLSLAESYAANLSSCCGMVTAFETSGSPFAAARMSIRTLRLKAASSAAEDAREQEAQAILAYIDAVQR